MAKVWCIRFKKQIRGYDPDEASSCPEHKNVGRAIKHLDYLANVQGWQPLTAFVSEDPDVALDLIDDEDEAEEILKKLGKVKWFTAKDAMATVRKLIDAIEELPRRLPLTENNAAKIVAELKDIEQILEHAAKKNVLFRFFAEFG